MSALKDDEPKFELIEDEHFEGPDEPPIGREFYEEKDESNPTPQSKSKEK